MSFRNRSNIEESDVEVKQRFSTPATESDSREYRSRISHRDNGDTEHVSYYTPMNSPSRRRRVAESPDGVSFHASNVSDSSAKDICGSPKFHAPTASVSDARYRSTTPRVPRWSCSEDSSDDAGAVNTKPDSKRRHTSAGERRYEGERCKGSHHRSRKVSFYDSISLSESDSDKPSHRKQFMKAPKFEGSSMSFETFYAKFQICAKYNRWSKSEQLAFLSASLSGEAGQVLWDSDPSITSSLSKLTQLLKSRFGGTARADKFRMELRSRVRQPGETLEKLHQDIRRCMALAFSDVDAKARERLATDYFIGALNDPDLSLKVLERNPKTLDEALFAAQICAKYNRWSKSEQLAFLSASLSGEAG